jgi:hypothetical protein
VRAVNIKLIEQFLLNSLDGAASAITAQQSVMVRCGPNRTKVCLFVRAPPLVEGHRDGR